MNKNIIYNLYTTLYKDEPEVLAFTGTDNECMAWFLKNTAYSYTNALKSGLARLEEIVPEPVKEHTAQVRLRQLLERVPKEEGHARTFLQKCYKAWDGYSEDQYSYPHWQLRKLEEGFGFTVWELNKRYPQASKI